MIDVLIFIDHCGYVLLISFSLIGVWMCMKALAAFRGYRFIDKIRGRR